MRPNETLLIFEEQIQEVIKALRGGTIRMASNCVEPWNPLRPGKEITLDEKGENVLPDREVGISLAASLGHLQMIWRKGRENYLFIVDRDTYLEEGFEFHKQSNHHWMIVVNRKMKKAE